MSYKFLSMSINERSRMHAVQMPCILNKLPKLYLPSCCTVTSWLMDVLSPSEVLDTPDAKVSSSAVFAELIATLPQAGAAQTSAADEAATSTASALHAWPLIDNFKMHMHHICSFTHVMHSCTAHVHVTRLIRLRFLINTRTHELNHIYVAAWRMQVELELACMM